jgi:hypothetical protein
MGITEMRLKLALRCRQHVLILDFWPIHESISDKFPSGEAIPIMDRPLRYDDTMIIARTTASMSMDQNSDQSLRLRVLD